jgi:hypothetical protein
MIGIINPTSPFLTFTVLYVRRWSTLWVSDILTNSEYSALFITGVAGLLGAVGSLHFRQAAPIPSLRAINPYVTASLEEWSSASQLDASISRQTAPAYHLHDFATAGALQLLCHTTKFLCAAILQYRWRLPAVSLAYTFPPKCCVTYSSLIDTTDA